MVLAMHPTPILLLLLCAPAAVPALELFDFTDLRLGVSRVGGSLDQTVKLAGAVRLPDGGEWRSAHRYALDLVAGTDLGLVSLAYGIGVADDVRWNGQVRQDAWTVHAQAGPYIQFGSMVNFELLPFVGTGSSKLREELTDDTDRAGYLEYGGHLNVVVALGSLVVGGQAGYIKTGSTHTFETGGSARDYELKGGDYTFGAFLGWRF